jgi:hypothetical protein
LNAPSLAVQKIQASAGDPFRTVGLQQSFCGDYAAVYGLEDIRSCAPLSNMPFMEMVTGYPGISSDFWRLIISDPVKAQPLLNMLNVRYLLDRPGVAPPEHSDFRVLDRSDFTVLENPEVWPRAFFSNQIIPMATLQQFSQRLGEGDRRPFITMTPEEIAKQAGLSRLSAGPPADVTPATHYQLRPNSTAFDIRAPAAGVVCLTESQAKDFTVRINGQPGQVLTINNAFKGVYLNQPGNYHVIFTYRPRYWRTACTVFWISLFSALVIAARAFAAARTKPPLTTHS